MCTDGHIHTVVHVYEFTYIHKRIYTTNGYSDTPMQICLHVGFPAPALAAKPSLEVPTRSARSGWDCRKRHRSRNRRRKGRALSKFEPWAPMFGRKAGRSNFAPATDDAHHRHRIDITLSWHRIDSPMSCLPGDTQGISANDSRTSPTELARLEGLGVWDGRPPRGAEMRGWSTRMPQKRK